MKFCEFRRLIEKVLAENDFQIACDVFEDVIFGLNKEEFLDLLSEIGAIPENIKHDSSEEKFYAKISDIMLARCFVELGLKASVSRQRSNCADVIAKSEFHNYSLVADAKTYRLSRTAKNQKDFKVLSMAEQWRQDSEYSVLCCPYYQYPKTRSQIYEQALEGNVLLFSWEFFILLIREKIKETVEFSLAKVWNWSNELSKEVAFSEKDVCFLDKQTSFIKAFLNYSDEKFQNALSEVIEKTIARGEEGKAFWENEISKIKNYSKEEAINELIRSSKLNEKINTIDSCINQLRGQYV